MLFGSWDVLTCLSTSKVPTPEKVPTPLGADTCRHLDVPTRADIWMLFGSWDVLICVSTSKVPTPLGADTFRCRHVLNMNVIWKLGCADMCQHLEGADTWEGADTSRCRHIYVPTRADIWMLFGSWDVLTCVSTSKVPTPEKVPTRADTSRCRHVPIPLGADTCDISHMNFTWILECAGKCQHLDRCRHQERCRHMLACVNT